MLADYVKNNMRRELSTTDYTINEIEVIMELTYIADNVTIDEAAGTITITTGTNVTSVNIASYMTIMVTQTIPEIKAEIDKRAAE